MTRLEYEKLEEREEFEILESEEFHDMAMSAMADIGLDEDESERALEDYLWA